LDWCGWSSFPPGDVAAERRAVVSAVDELNRRVAPDKGYQLAVWRWETDARSGLHIEGPQGLIDERMGIDDADIVVGVFWRRFGTPTGDAQSGTEHELRRAWAAWRQRGRPDVMVYFCQREGALAGLTETEQRQRLARFREQLPREQLWWSYDDPHAFERLIRGHLEDVVLRRAAERQPPPAPTPVATTTTTWFNVPAPITAFAGRETELEALEEAIGLADRAVIAQAIGGLGGVGKTQLAARYAHAHAHAGDYDLIAWIRAEDGGTADLAHLAARLGLALADNAAGRVQDAIAIYEPLLADQERILGNEHPDTLTTRHNLAFAYRATGRAQDAIAIYEPLLADHERILGGEHPSTLLTCGNLAFALLVLRRVDEAIAILEPLLPDFERIMGAEHPETLTTRRSLAAAYRVAGRVEDADRLQTLTRAGMRDNGPL